MSDLPQGWLSVRLADASEDISYGFTTSASSIRGKAKLLRITDVQDYSVDWATVPYCVDAPPTKFDLASGDIVIARTGATTGKSYLIADIPERTVFASYLIRVRASGAIGSNYLSRFMRSPDYWSQITVVSKGTAQPGANASILGNLRIPLPPLPEQRRIVRKLDALSARTATARKHLTAIDKLVERYKSGILQHAFRGTLTEDFRLRSQKLSPLEVELTPLVMMKLGIDRVSIDRSNAPHAVPDSWKWFALPVLGELARGKSRHRPRNDASLFGGAYPFIQTGDVSNCKGHISNFSNTYSEKGMRQSRLWPAGTLCITIAANIAETGILHFSSCFPDSVVGFIANKNLTSERFIEYFIRTVRADLEAFAPGVAQKNINLTTLSAVFVPTPPLTEQCEIVRRIETAFAKIDRLASEAAKALKLTDRLDQRILVKAFAGELVPQNPGDEPAAKLLERIRAKRAATPKAKRGKKSKA